VQSSRAGGEVSAKGLKAVVNANPDAKQFAATDRQSANLRGSMGNLS